MDLYQEFSQKFDNFYVNDSFVNEILRTIISRPGKRIRPILFLNICLDFGIELTDEIFNIAICIELCHLSSLVHDDLPSVDNDDFRSQLPTIHRIYGEGNAIYSGIQLLLDAFTLVKNRDILQLVIDSFGRNGVVVGQILDINKINLNVVNVYKTGATFGLIFAIPAFLKGLNVVQFDSIGRKFGEFYQAQDDAFDEGKENPIPNNSTDIEKVFDDLIASKKILSKKHTLIFLNKIINRSY
jgi:geranylgeranyl diphosphate synthase type II